MILLSGLFFACTEQRVEHVDLTDLPDTVDFNYHIRSILAQNCFLCHGPDPSSRQGDLRLDTYEGATAALKNGKAIIPHNAGNSLVMDRISSSDPDFQMPPPEMKKTLTSKEIALIEKWIDQGAEWKEHWAFIKPAIEHKGTLEKEVSKQIDVYINQKLEQEKLQSSGPATTNQLIRRVAYLITGLPPTIEELERFSKDTDESYEQMVDYYLASQRYGERWARHWMDLVRYAEHRGHEFDYTINGAPLYRDYLIRAFNLDLPYDQLVKEHLAGDLIEEQRLHPTEGFNESIIATAYANLGEGKHSPVSIKEEESIRIDNMIDVTSKTFQALTVSCAKCHDHKFDPIPTTDYYAMYGMFESTRFGPKPLTDQRLIKTASQEILAEKEKAKNAIIQLLKSDQTDIAITESIDIKQFIEAQSDQSNNNTIKVLGDFTKGSWGDWQTDGYAFGEAPTSQNLSIDLENKKIQVAPSAATSRVLAPGLLGTLRSPTFIIEHDTISVLARGKESTIRVIVDNFQLIQNPLYGSLSQLVNSDQYKMYNLDVSMLKGHKAYIEILPGIYRQHQYHLDSSAYVDVQSVYATNTHLDLQEPETIESQATFSIDDQNEAIAAWQNNTPSHRDINIINAKLEKSNRTLLSSSTVLASIERINNNSSALIGSPMIHTMSEGDAVLSPVFIRGSYEDLSENKVAHGFLTATKLENDDFPQEGSGRLAWAKSVLHPDNPLTSRVMVNRIWHHLFGRGIIETVDNFGLQGKLPTHPELLDYLAITFVKDNWSIKRLIKEILMSETFRKSTIPVEENLSADADNLYLHHFPIRRLEAEAIRDGVLASSQRLDTSMFGHPVPIHLTEFMTGRGRPRNSGPLDGQGRRSVYGSIRRNFLPPMMLTFDMPIPFSSFGKRNTTNVPAQSLALMNDPFVQEQAEHWAQNTIDDPTKNTTERIEHIYLTAFARKPTKIETQEALQLLQDLAGGSIADEQLKNNLELWTHFCHSIYNLKEFIHLL